MRQESQDLITKEGWIGQSTGRTDDAMIKHRGWNLSLVFDGNSINDE